MGKDEKNLRQDTEGIPDIRSDYSYSSGLSISTEVFCKGNGNRECKGVRDRRNTCNRLKVDGNLSAGGDGELDVKSRSFIDFALCIDPAFMLGNDRFAMATKAIASALA